MASRLLTRRAGTAALAAVAVLGTTFVGSAGATAAPDAPLLDSTASWQYWDKGTDPAAGLGGVLDWTQPDSRFDDSAWPAGTGPFGTEPDGSITTPMTLRYDSGANILTYFLRTNVTLEAADLAGIDELQASLRYDDGVILYVNGVEAARTATTTGIDATTTNLQGSTGQSSDMESWNPRLDASLFTEGENVISAAVYQRGPSSSDIYFDFTSLAPAAPPVVEPVISEVSLNIGADETQANLAWFTRSGVDESVQLALKAAQSDDTFPASSARTFPATATGDSFEDDPTAWVHSTVTGLTESTEYIYRVGSADGGWSDTFEFSTEDFTSSAFNFLFVGDPQIGSGGGGGTEGDAANWRTTVSTMTTAFPDSAFLLSAGDQVNRASSQEEYAGFFSPDELSGIPLATNDGNHDTAGTAYDQHFNMPNVAPNRDYTYMYNDVLVVSVNANKTSETQIAEHVAFLEKAIAEAGNRAAWTILTFHQSAYSQGFHMEDRGVQNFRANFVDDVSRLGVDLVLSGHDHIYTRSYLMEGDSPVVPTTEPAIGDVLTPDDDQTLYIIGNSSTSSKHYDFFSPDGSGDKQYYTARWNQDYTADFSNVEVTPAGLTVTTYNVADLSIVDEVTIQRPDVTAPVLSVPEATEIAFGQDFDPKAVVTASDDRDGDISSAVTVTGSVNTQKAGKYTLTYSVTDAAGNATTVERTVTVLWYVPIEEDLTAAAHTLEVLSVDRAAGTVTARVSTDLSDERLEFSVFSEPTAVGAITPATDGTVTVAMPVGLTAGEHRLAAVAADGTVVWDAFDWAAPAQAVPAGATQDEAMLGNTGFDGAWLVPAALLALLAGAALMMMRRNRRTIIE
jgi:hypothetical protein